MKPSGENVMVKVLDMKNEKGEKVESCPHPGELVRILLSEKPEIMNLIRVKEESK
jgi:putative protease